MARPKKTSAKTKKITAENSSYETTAVNENSEEKILQQKWEEYAVRQTNARYWFWVGVVGLAAIIIIIWGWSLINQFTLISWKKTSDTALLDKTRSEWDRIFTTNKQKMPEGADIQNRIKIILKEIAAANSTATTSTATTTAATTTLSTTTKNQ